MIRHGKLETLPSTISKKEQQVVEQTIGLGLVIKCPQVTELIDSAVDIFETRLKANKSIDIL